MSNTFRAARPTATPSRSYLAIVLLLLTSLLVVVPPTSGDARADDTWTGTSSGRDFWLAFPGVLIEGEAPDLRLYLAASQAGSGTVTVPALGFDTDFTVTPGEVTTVDLPIEAMLSGSDVVADGGVRVVADTDVSVYGINQVTFSTDAFLGLPIHALGTDYVVASWENSITQAGTQLAVVGVEDGTTVTITPSVTTSGRTAGEPFDITLDEGQTYQLRSRTNRDDLTGTTVTSSAPVAVFGAHECANVPAGVRFCDNLLQQLLPTSTFGSEFVTVPFADRAADTFRVVAAVDDTTVAIDGEEVATLDRGEFHDTILSEPAHVTTSAPASLYQYMHGNEYDREISNHGDPSFVSIPPTEQFLPEYTVTTPAAGFVNHHINLVVQAGAAGEITIDGVAVPADDYVPIGGSGYVGAQVPVAAGSKVLRSPVPFNAIMYGTNQDDSYAYVGGVSLSPVALVDSIELEFPEPSYIGEEQCVDAVVRDREADPLRGIRVDFTVEGTVHDEGFSFTDVEGRAPFCTTGDIAGEDTITARVGSRSVTETRTWTPAPPPEYDPDGLVQSFWIFGPLWTIDDEGNEEDLLEDLIEAVQDDLEEPVELSEDMTFHEAPGLAPELLGPDGQPRTDVDVRAGVISTPGAPRGGAIAVIATPRAGAGTIGPRGRSAIAPDGGNIRLNLDVLGAGRVEPGHHVAAAPAYGETWPDPDAAPPTSDVDPIETLADRFTPDPDTGEIAATIASVPGADGPVVAAIPGVVGSVTSPFEGVVVTELPAISRMLDHFLNASVAQEVGMSAAFAFVPTPFGIAVGAFGIISTFFKLYDAMGEVTDLLGHMGSDEPFVPAGAASRGDPHLRTHSGTRYSLMSVGEFVLARTEGLEVQARAVPVGTSGSLSLNEVVVVRLGDAVIEVPAGVQHLIVDGVEIGFQDLQEPLELASGSVVRDGSRVLVRSDDGDLVSLRCGTECAFVDVYITPAELGSGGWEGLLGDNAGEIGEDLRDRDGTLRGSMTFDEIHGSWADEWRVTDAESLFTYAAGESTADFTDRSFPVEELSLDLLPADDVAAARAVCRAAGMGDHDQTSFDECTLDVAATGDVCFARSAQPIGADFSLIGTDEDEGWSPDPEDPADPGDGEDPDPQDPDGEDPDGEDPGDGDQGPRDPDAVCTDTDFSDVPTDHPHVAGICRVDVEGIALGFRDGTYRPGQDLTRAQLASFVARALEVAGYELPAVTAPSRFADTRRSVHAAAIDQLATAGIVEGVGEGRFRPAAAVTREQFASILVRAVRWTGTSDRTAAIAGPHFGDTAGSVHAANVDLAMELGLTRGVRPGVFAPASPATRGQTATFLARFLDAVASSTDGPR